jgi:putative heme-binding domain-containing protein
MMLSRVLLLAAALTVVAAPAQGPDAARIETVIEALTRLDPEQVQSNERLRDALAKVLAATRGTPRFVKLVEQFKPAGQDPALLDVAAKFPGDEAGVAAVRLVLAANKPLLLEALATTNAAPLAQAIGNTGDKQAVPMLLPIVTALSRDAALRRTAVRALAQSQEGAAALVKLARDGALADELKFAASAALAGVRWPAIRNEAATLLPPPPARNSEPLPPVAELLKMAGDAKRGEAVFFRDEAQCSKCHIVLTRGQDFGPALSEIGTKLGRDALLESILDPSAGISMGYETWTLQLKDGEDASGLIVSDAADEVALKVAGGLVTRYKKSDIKARVQSKLSIMPAGLQQAMSAQELVDLVEFLSSLKKK